MSVLLQSESMSLPLFYTVLAWLILPGFLLGVSLRLRGLILVSATPLFSVAQIGLVALASAYLPLPDLRLSVAIFALLFSFLVYLLTRRVLYLPPLCLPSHTLPYKLILFFSSLATSAVTGITFAQALGDLNISPSLWDLQFHNNVARWISDTNNASPLVVSSFAGGRPPQPGAFYPNALHLLAALSQLGNIMAAVNTVQIVMVSLFGAGVVCAAATLFPRHIWVPPLTALLAVDFIAFNSKLHATGGRWAFGFGFALTGWFIALLAALWRRSQDTHTRGQSFFQIIIPVIAAYGAVGLGHAGALYLMGFIVIPAAFSALLHPVSPNPPKILNLIGLSLAILIFAGILAYGGLTVNAIAYPQISGPITALIEAVSGGEMSVWYPLNNPLASPSLAILSILGILGCALRPRMRWLLISYLLAVCLYVAAVYTHLPWYFLLHPLYNDRTRTASLLSLVAPLLIVAGIETLFQRSQSFLGEGWKRHLALSIPLVAIVLAFFHPGGILRSQERYEIVNSAARVSKHDLLDNQEVTFMKSFAHSHPSLGIIGHPASGAPLYYAVTGIKALPRYTSLNLNQSETQLLEKIDRVFEDPSVCQMLKDNKIGYFYYDAELYRSGDVGSTNFYKPLRNLENERKNLKLVAADGKNSIYQFPCGWIK
ncbi:hypothetical protein KRX54_06535 [Actinomycetaceae bacterium TAE3-ERU4]|nr:hypothetical protein [Actinomycetaceae bacterium TAE3-ERU4]